MRKLRILLRLFIIVFSILNITVYGTIIEDQTDGNCNNHLNNMNGKQPFSEVVNLTLLNREGTHFISLTGWDLADINEVRADIEHLKIEYYGQGQLHKLRLFPNLVSLDLSGMLDQTDVFTEHVAEVTKLKHLVLPWKTIPEHNFARLSSLTNLAVLNMQRSGFSWLGLPHLYGLKKIEKIDLSETIVTDEAVEKLIENFPNLQHLVIPEHSVSKDIRDKCLKALADRRQQSLYR